MKKILSFIFIILFLSGCTISKYIHLNNDGSAVIIASPDLDNDSFYFTSNLISNRSNKTTLKFSISTIDSLGNYLSPLFNKNIYWFQYNGKDSLLLFELNDEVFKDERWICHLRMEISSDKKITKIITENTFIKKKKNKVIITKSKQKFNKNEKMNLIIVFGE